MTLCAFLSYVYVFENDVYSQNDEIGVLELLEIKIFFTAIMVGRLIGNFLEILSMDFALWWLHLCNFLEKKKKKKKKKKVKIL